MNIPTQLFETIQRNSERPPSPAVNVLLNEILTKYGEAVQAVLFYGSCLHKEEDLNGLFDLYVLVNNYESVNRNIVHATLNRLLPPNVFYLEVPYERQTIRAKYAVLSIDDLLKGTSHQWFHSYLWARFCQPTLIIYSKDDAVTEKIINSFAQAVITFLSKTLPRMPLEFTLRDIWQKGLELTYRSEFRPEQADKQVRLFDSRPEYFEDITRKSFESMIYRIHECHRPEGVCYTAEIPASVRKASTMSWAVRIVQGKILSVLRLIKGTLTFEGGVDYILWKINRHSGVTMEASPFLKRHPVLAMIALSLKLYRRGGIK